MRFKEWDNYLDSMLKHVKFTPDRKKIRQEFGEHMEDMFDDYVSFGMSEDEAKNSVLENIGDARDVGRLMNKAHNAVIGWIWQVLKVCLVIVLLASLIPMTRIGRLAFVTIGNISEGYEDTYFNGDESYRLPLDEKIKIDNYTLDFDELIVYENGVCEIRYKEKTSLLDRTAIRRIHFGVYNDKGRQLENVGIIDDDLDSFIAYDQFFYGNLEDDSDKLIIEYRGNEELYKGRHFRIEIDLPENGG